MVMKKIQDFLDATYLKVAGVDEASIKEDLLLLDELLQDALSEKYRCVMIRPCHVTKAKQYFIQNKSQVLVGTVIDFPLGNSGVEAKLKEATEVIENGADELDFVIDYTAFKNGLISQVQNEVKVCTELALKHNKVVKWIIETAALNDTEIIKITTLVKKVVVRYFKETDYHKVFVKTSTGFYPTQDGISNGASPHVVTLILENATPLNVKASGGVKTFEEAVFYLLLGVKRIGTSSQKQIVSIAKHTL